MDNPSMKETIVRLGPIDQVPVGQGQCFRIGNREIAVFRCRDGRLLAVQNRCPHKAGPLSEGIIGNGKVVCPLHGHKFDLTTGEGSEPHECVKTFKVWEDKETIFVEWPAPQATK